MSINNKTEAKDNYELCKSFFESLVKENPQSITNQTNFAEIIAITAIFALHQNQTNELARQQLQKALNIWQFLYEQTKSVYYKKKIDLVMQYTNKTTIVNLTKE